MSVFSAFYSLTAAAIEVWTTAGWAISEIFPSLSQRRSLYHVTNESSVLDKHDLYLSLRLCCMMSQRPRRSISLWPPLMYCRSWHAGKILEPSQLTADKDAEVKRRMHKSPRSWLVRWQMCVFLNSYLMFSCTCLHKAWIVSTARSCDWRAISFHHPQIDVSSAVRASFKLCFCVKESHFLQFCNIYPSLAP